jgi:hypothetical protein
MRLRGVVFQCLLNTLLGILKYFCLFFESIGIEVFEGVLRSEFFRVIMGRVLNLFGRGVYPMRTTGKRVRKKEDHVVNKGSNGKFKESQKDRYKRMREESMEDGGVINTLMVPRNKRLRPEKKPFADKYGIMRTSIYRTETYDNHRFPHIAEILCKEYGFILVQLAEVFGVVKGTVQSWIQTHPDFRTAVFRGREAFDTGRVEKSLLKRALGYKYTEKTERNVFLIGRKANSDVEVAVPAREVVTTQKELPPDVKAIMFWLQNRDSDRWKAVSYLNAQVNANKTVTTVKVDADLENMSVEQIKALRGLVESSQQGKGEVRSVSMSDEEMGQIVYNAGQKLTGEDNIEDYDLEE